MIFSKYRGFGMDQLPSGQLGNHLFQANLLFQVEQEVGVKSFHKTFDGSKLFPALNRTGFLFPRNPNARQLSREEILEMPWENLIQLTKECLESGEVLLFPRGILGEYHYTCSRIHPSSFFELPKDASFHNRLRVAIHLRGRDFQNWDNTAILPSEYYLDALNYLRETCSEDFDLTVFTDDKSLPAYKLLRERVPFAVDGSGQKLQDFVDLGNSDCIISSPSTFAFWAALLGNPKIVIHSKNWVHRKMESGDIFWSRLNDTQKIMLI